MTDADLDVVRDIYAEGIATRNATFETEVPTADVLAAKWLPGHRWVAELDGQVVGWTAISPVSRRACYAGVGETSVYVTEARPRPRRRQGAAVPTGQRGRRGRPLDAADLGLPREPRLHRPAPLRRLPHAGRPLADRPARRRVARHRAARATASRATRLRDDPGRYS